MSIDFFFRKNHCCSDFEEKDGKCVGKYLKSFIVLLKADAFDTRLSKYHRKFRYDFFAIHRCGSTDLYRTGHIPVHWTLKCIE